MRIKEAIKQLGVTKQALYQAARKGRLDITDGQVEVNEKYVRYAQTNRRATQDFSGGQYAKEESK